MNYKILIADDQEFVLDNFRKMFKNHLDIEPTLTQQSLDALKLIQENPYDYAVVVLDYHFEGQKLNGEQVAQEILKINPKLIVLICTGDMGREAPISCLKAGVSDFIQKDEPLDKIIARIRSNFRKSE